MHRGKRSLAVAGYTSGCGPGKVLAGHLDGSSGKAGKVSPPAIILISRAAYLG
jgi:hypothetical protein